MLVCKHNFSPIDLLNLYKCLYFDRFRTVSGLQYVLVDQLQQLDVARNVVVLELDKLTKADPSMLVDDVVQCCLRPPLKTRLLSRLDRKRCKVGNSVSSNM